jgi:hypothetical protein
MLKLFGGTVKWVMVTVSMNGGAGTISTTPYPNEQICRSQLEQAVDNDARACMAEKDYLETLKSGQPLPVARSSASIKAENDAEERLYQERQRKYEEQQAEYLRQQKLIEEQKAAAEAQPQN